MELLNQDTEGLKDYAEHMVQHLPGQAQLHGRPALGADGFPGGGDVGGLPLQLRHPVPELLIELRAMMRI